jgi:hypothetical protein
MGENRERKMHANLTEYGWTDPESTGTEIGTRHQCLKSPGQSCWLSLTRLVQMS